MMAAAQDATHPARKKAGYRKIQKTCELARIDGFSHAWVDTCCIDKSSSAELSEAINSMFQWYQSAKICYAYLADLISEQNELEHALPKCRWFTRGWCLQELIAPREILFYDSAWRLCGRKTDSDIRSLISRVTTIHEDVLVDPAKLEILPVAQKMSWAADRETTRTEDMAYCLLGIFDINMPMLYGEGKKAFQRLQEEIIKRSNDLSIFAWADNRTLNSHQVPPDGFIDLFASSPHDFKGCHSFVLGRPPVPRNISSSPIGSVPASVAMSRRHTFSLTNNGLLLSGTELCLDFENGCYSLVLGHVGGDDVRHLYLRRLGTKIFFRVLCDTPEPSGPIIIEGKNLEVFIPPKIGALEMMFISSSKTDYIRLCAPIPGFELDLFHSTIMDVFPSDNWDASRFSLVQEHGEDLSCGYFKFNGAILDVYMTQCWPGPPPVQRHVDDFFLIWRIEYLNCFSPGWTGRVPISGRISTHAADSGHPLLVAGDGHYMEVVQVYLYTEADFARAWGALKPFDLGLGEIF